MFNTAISSFQCDFCRSTHCVEQKPAPKNVHIPAETFKIVKCTRCHLVSLYPIPTPQMIQEIYTQYSEKKDRLRVEQIRRDTVYPHKIKKLKQYAPGNRLLDIGAGLGTFVDLAKQEGFDPVGIELSTEQCHHAKTLYGLDLINEDVFHIKDDLGQFDVIHLHHVLEHVPSPSQLLDLITTRIHKHGILLIEVPYQLTRIQDIIHYPATKKKYPTPCMDHIYFFSPQTLAQMVTAKGFHILEFNQHRPDTPPEDLSPVWYYLRQAFRKFTTALWLPSGSFIELYCQQ